MFKFFGHESELTLYSTAASRLSPPIKSYLTGIFVSYVVSKNVEGAGLHFVSGIFYWHFCRRN